MSKRASWVALILSTLFFVVFFLLPILVSIQSAFFDHQGKFSLAYVFAVFQSPIHREGLLNAFGMGFWSTLTSMLIALPLALVYHRYQFPLRNLVSSLLLIPLILPPFVGAIGVKQILGQSGVLNAFLIELGLMSAESPMDWLGKGQFLGVVLMNALHLYPIVYLNLSAALANLDPSMEEAADDLGCTKWRRFQRVTLPLIVPGLFAGGAIVFIWSFTELGVPLMFDYHRVTSVQIFDGLKEIPGNPLPYALVVVMLLISLVLYFLSQWVVGNKDFATVSRASLGREIQLLSKRWGWTVCGGFLLVVFVSVLPHLGLILKSFSGDWYQTVLPSHLTWQHYENALGHPLTVTSIGNSLKYSFLATVLSVCIGFTIAYLVQRTALPGRRLLDAMSMLPLAVPGLVLAFGYFSMTREGQALHFLKLGEDPVLLLVMAYAIRRLPYVVRSAVAGFQQTHPMLEEAAQSLGCPPSKAVWKITVPLIAANLIAGGLLAFSFAMLEVSDSLILAEQSRHYPITKAIYSLVTTLGNGEQMASALGVWAMMFLGVTMVAVGMLLGRKLGALFRM